MEMKDEFLFKTHMLDKNGEKTGVDQIADYMFRADMIYRMKLASDMGLPVLTLIARELEEKFDENSSFPVTATKNDPNALSRQNVGRIAKFIMDKLGAKNNIFVRKHAYMVHTLDDEILIDIMGAMEQKKAVLLSCVSRKNDKKHEITAVVLKIHCSVQTGRNYLIMYFTKQKRLMSVRVDSIVKVTPLDVVADYDTYYRYYEDNRRFLWGTSFGKSRRYGQKEHIHMEIMVDEAKEMYVVKRLEREKRSGTVAKISNGLYSFDIDLFDANEAFPWIKTFIGRIVTFETTNEELQNKFDSDIARLYEIYGGAYE